ncbi:hypothetical protein [Reichenbachiella sp.]
MNTLGHALSIYGTAMTTSDAAMNACPHAMTTFDGAMTVVRFARH